jgi:SM-20-related protein
VADLLEFNAALDRARYRAEFEQSGQVQVPGVLSDDSAARLREILQGQTPWLLSWSAGDNGPRYIAPDQLVKMPRDDLVAIERAIAEAGNSGQFCYIYMSYPLDIAFANKWHPGSVQEQIRAELRGEPFAELLRDVTGHAEIVGADGYLTHFAPGHFLSQHSDEGTRWRRVAAYVLNLTFVAWNPDFGGYLTFFDERGDVESGFMPRYNSLNIFSVPRLHSVSRVAPFAPQGRAGISGWARETLYPVT